MSILPLILTDAVVRKRGQTIIGPVTEEIAEAGFTIIMGPNGAGKTTLLRLMEGLERPRAGRVDWQVSDELARPKTAFVFQAPIIMRRSVADNIAYPLRVQSMTKAAAGIQARSWAENIGLGPMIDMDAALLSGGEKQKLAIARALIAEPEVLFLDEPTTNLDGRALREIEAVLQAASAGGTRMIMTTHNIGQARRLATEIIFLHRGSVRERASATEFFDGAKTAQARAFLSGDIVE